MQKFKHRKLTPLEKDYCLNVSGLKAKLYILRMYLGYSIKEDIKVLEDIYKVENPYRFKNLNFEFLVYRLRWECSVRKVDLEKAGSKWAKLLEMHSSDKDAMRLWFDFHWEDFK